MASEPTTKRCNAGCSAFPDSLQEFPQACPTFDDPTTLSTWRQVVTSLFQLPLKCSHTKNLLGEGVHLTQPGIALTAHYEALTFMGTSCQVLIQEPMHRSWCGLTYLNLDDLGDALQFPTDLAGFLKWPEDATNEHEVMFNVHLPPWPHALLNNPKSLYWRGWVISGTLQMPRWARTQVRWQPYLPLGLQLPVEPEPQHHTMLDLIEWPKDWVRAYACHEDKGTTQLVAGVSSLCTGDTQVSYPCLLSTVSGQETDYRFPGCPHGPRLKNEDGGIFPPASAPYAAMISCCLGTSSASGHIHVRWGKRKTLALAKALQSCSKWSGWPYSLMCRDSQGSSGMHAQSDAVWRGGCPRDPTARTHGSLANSIPYPRGRGCTLLSASPQWLKWLPPTLLRHEEQAPESESAASLGEAVTEPQGMQKCPPPPGFESPCCWSKMSHWLGFPILMKLRVIWHQSEPWVWSCLQKWNYRQPQVWLKKLSILSSLHPE